MSSRSPYASRLSTFRAPGWGTLAVLPPCRWRNATSQKLVPFSHRSASRIFIRQPGRIPSPVVTQDGDHQFDAGEKHSRERALTGLAGGSDFDNAGLVGGERRQLQRVGLAGSAGSSSAPGAPSCRGSGCRAARTGGPPKTSCAVRAAFVFWGCPAFAPVRRLCARPGGSEWESPGGRMASVVGAEVVAAEEVLIADGITATIRAPGLRLFGFDSLSSPLEWGHGRGHYCSGVRPEAVAAAVWPSGAEVVVAATGAGDGSHLGPCRPASPPIWGVVRTRRGRTGVPFVMAS
jgi:hypothetical protein